jgi:hypothetical protein
LFALFSDTYDESRPFEVAAGSSVRQKLTASNGKNVPVDHVV